MPTLTHTDMQNISPEGFYDTAEETPGDNAPRAVTRGHTEMFVWFLQSRLIHTFDFSVGKTRRNVTFINQLFCLRNKETESQNMKKSQGSNPQSKK